MYPYSIHYLPVRYGEAGLELRLTIEGVLHLYAGLAPVCDFRCSLGVWVDSPYDKGLLYYSNLWPSSLTLMNPSHLTPLFPCFPFSSCCTSQSTRQACLCTQRKSLTMQLHSSWAVHKSRTLTHRVHRPAQEAEPSAPINKPGRQSAVNQMCGKPGLLSLVTIQVINGNFWSNPLLGQALIKSWQLLQFCSHVRLRTNWGKCNVSLYNSGDPLSRVLSLAI